VYFAGSALGSSLAAPMALRDLAARFAACEAPLPAAFTLSSTTTDAVPMINEPFL
jgi:hypothetical protein